MYYKFVLLEYRFRGIWETLERLLVYSSCYFFDEPKPEKPIIAIMSLSSCCMAVSFASSTRACSRFAFFSAFFAARAAASRSRISASRFSKSNDFALEASFVFSRRNAIRALTCSTVDRSIRVVWPRARRSAGACQGRKEVQREILVRTSSTVDMVQVTCTVFICTITDLTVESRYTGPASANVLNDHGLSEVLI